MKGIWYAAYHAIVAVHWSLAKTHSWFLPKYQLLWYSFLKLLIRKQTWLVSKYLIRHLILLANQSASTEHFFETKLNCYNQQRDYPKTQSYHRRLFVTEVWWNPKWNPTLKNFQQKLQPIRKRKLIWIFSWALQ